jgi:hypothetical protein
VGATKDPRSPLWQYVEILSKATGGGSYKWRCSECNNLRNGSYTRMKGRGGSYKWRCSECNNVRNGSYTRVKGHLTGLTNTGVTVCPGPNDTNGKSGPSLSPVELQFFASLQDVADRRHAKEKVPVQGSATKPPIPSRPAVVTNKRRTLEPLEAAFNNKGREVVDEHVARCIYLNGARIQFGVLPLLATNDLGSQ